MARNPKPARKENRRFNNMCKIEATFTPLRTHDLKPDSPRIGERLVLRRGWKMEPGYNRYGHQLVWVAGIEASRAGHTFGWIPSCDLSNVKPLR